MNRFKRQRSDKIQSLAGQFCRTIVLNRPQSSCRTILPVSSPNFLGDELNMLAPCKPITFWVFMDLLTALIREGVRKNGVI